MAASRNVGYLTLVFCPGRFGRVLLRKFLPTAWSPNGPLRLKGTVILEGQTRPISEITDLPNSDFQIHTLNLVGMTFWANGLQDELSRLPALPHLKELYLNGRLWYGQPATVIEETLAQFAGATNLEKLILSKPVQTYIPLEDPAVKRLQTMTNLAEIRLHQTQAPGATLAPFTHLKYLDVSFNRYFNDVGMRSLKSMRELSKLYLEGHSGHR